MINSNMWHYIESGTKSGPVLEFGTIQHPEILCTFSGTGRENSGLSC